MLSQDLTVTANLSVGVDVNGRMGGFLQYGSDFDTTIFDRDSLTSYTYNYHPVKGGLDASML
jgi:hypothetical protein